MNIRAITGFLDPGYPVDPQRIDSVTVCLKQIRDELGELGYEVQTLRLAAPPPSEMSTPVPAEKRKDLALQLEAECFLHDIDYANLGPALPDELDGFEAIPKVLGATENVFTSGVFADMESGLSLQAARACAKVILESSDLLPDGFANLRFAALANVPPGTPFFPAAYHIGGPTTIAIATEAASLAVDSLVGVSSLSTARRRLISMIEAHASALTKTVERIALLNEMRFSGIDFSLAPYPEPERSIGTALEAMGLQAVGAAGTVAAVAFLTDCLDRAQFRRVGFCGLILPVLEDTILAARAAVGILTVHDLLLYATLCGTGLDTIPLPGDVDEDTLYSILLDMGSLALRHNKPLTARLMPIPDKKAGDKTEFDFPYFADSGVMELPDQSLSALLNTSETIDIMQKR